MFEAGPPDMSALLAQAGQLQHQLVAARDRLAETQVTGSAASGLVTATVTGTGELVSVDIRPEACDPDDAETLGDMVVAAVRDATEQAERLAAEQLGPFAGGLEGLEGLGGLPGTDTRPPASGGTASPAGF